MEKLNIFYFRDVSFSPIISDFSFISIPRGITSNNHQEIHNMLQRLAPVASRAEKIFSETCQKFLRFTVPPNLKESIKSVADVNDLSSILKVFS